VTILTEALIAFQSEFFEISKREDHDGIDALRDSITIASLCMRHFRLNHLKENHIPITPENGYDSIETQSQIALKFLRWYSEKNNVMVRTALSPGGEFRCGQYKLDGYVEEKDLAIEVHGCVWHACKKHYPNDEFIMQNGKTAGLIRKLNFERMKFLKSQISKVEVIWECEIKDMLKSDQEMKQKFSEYLDEGPLNIRSCYFGGRTNPFKLYHKVKKGEKISYFDFTSLYPYTNFVTTYPVGHPTVHVLNKKVKWTKSKDNPYKLALLKVYIIPPKKIDVPVLPMKFDERLLFPLCKTCAQQYPQGAVIKNYTCPHSNKERGWISSCTSIELDEALDQGYKVTDLYRVLEFNEGDSSLFKGYVSEFLAMKIHASGFSKNIKTEEDQDIFIKECEEKFGIIIDKDKMIPNKAKRSIAKLCANNLWGRFSLRNLLTKVVITDSPEKLRELLDDKKIQVCSVYMLTEETVLITYEPKIEFLDENDTSNMILSLWTTSKARLFLLKALQKVANREDCQLLYCDTDSILFVHPENDNPLQSEQKGHLGELCNEFSSNQIIEEYISGGAKQYSLKILNLETGKREYILKVRGFTLNSDVQNTSLCYETFKSSVLKYAENGEIGTISVSYPRFIRPTIKTGTIVSTPMVKVYKPYVGKGVITEGYFVRDFGYTY
jgi:G:T-mismatch repair DNA endonuclease (very short patch repair protein)